MNPRCGEPRIPRGRPRVSGGRGLAVASGPYPEGVRPHAPTEFVAPPPDARLFSGRMRAGLGDCAPSGRIRLDALARWLQDIAYEDVEDAGLADSAVWVVRRTRMRIARFPRFAERCTVRTYCSGIGRMWAERRTTIVAERAQTEHAERAQTGVSGSAQTGDSGSAQTGDSGSAQAGDADGCGDVEAVALWVHLDAATGRPAPFEAQEIALYGDAAAGRRVTARLRHPQPTSGAERSTWTFRATECDIARHINNAAYWQPVEELLLNGDEPTGLDAEMEFRTPSQPGEKDVLRDGDMGWIVGADGATHASVALRPVP